MFSLDPGAVGRQNHQDGLQASRGWGCLSLCFRVLHVVRAEPQGPEGQLPWLLRCPQGISWWPMSTLVPGSPFLSAGAGEWSRVWPWARGSWLPAQSLHHSHALGVRMGLFLFKSPDAKRKRKFVEQREMAAAEGYHSCPGL